ncbi:hypothetical protein B0H14DRAFT_2597640 [Mycena olivaceomarginata]|nr:hypothetical protein B0H14DRAFT_2597640 [Mycena olivaceomarginata]
MAWGVFEWVGAQQVCQTVWEWGCRFLVTHHASSVSEGFASQRESRQTGVKRTVGKVQSGGVLRAVWGRVLVNIQEPRKVGEGVEALRSFKYEWTPRINKDRIRIFQYSEFKGLPIEFILLPSGIDDGSSSAHRTRTSSQRRCEYGCAGLHGEAAKRTHAEVVEADARDAEAAAELQRQRQDAIDLLSTLEVKELIALAQEKTVLSLDDLPADVSLDDLLDDLPGDAPSHDDDKERESTQGDSEYVEAMTPPLAKAPVAATKRTKKPARFETRIAIEEAAKKKVMMNGKKKPETKDMVKQKGVQNRLMVNKTSKVKYDKVTCTQDLFQLCGVVPSANSRSRDYSLTNLAGFDAI